MPSVKYKSADGTWLPIAGKSGVEAFNGRAGAVKPAFGDYTAEMVGAAEAGHMHTPDQVGAVNPNLLHNWYFANPVNQRDGYITCPGRAYSSAPRDDATVVGILPDGAYYKATQYDPWWHSFEMDGVTYYQASVYVLPGYVGVGYTIDRWFINNDKSPMVINDNGVTLSFAAGAVFYQHVELEPGEYTFSVLGEVDAVLTLFYTNHYWAGKWSDGIASTTFTVTEKSTYQVGIFGNVAGSIMLKAAKLELGSQQTLAHQDENGNWVLNEIPDYNEEFLKCCMSTADSTDPYANNKKTPAAIGALPIKPVVFTGNVKEITESGRYYCLGVSGGPTIYGFLDVYVHPEGPANRHLVFRSPYKDALMWTCGTDDNGATWSDWKQLATTNYALNKAGDTMEGMLKLLDGYTRQEYTEFFRNENITLLKHYTDLNGHYHSLLIAPDHGGLLYQRNITGDEPNYDILHTGNKPSGSYTGNGDATARTIETGGIGNALIIYSVKGIVIVTANGAYRYSFTAGMSGVGAIFQSGSVVTGLLTITSADECLNASGVTYAYQVL